MVTDEHLGIYVLTLLSSQGSFAVIEIFFKGHNQIVNNFILKIKLVGFVILLLGQNQSSVREFSRQLCTL